MRWLRLLPILLAIGCGSTATPPGTGTVRVAAAASIKPALEEILPAYREKHPGISVEATYGASGTFFAQITNGAPFDLFLSADTDYPRRLVEQGAGREDGFFRYATGRLVVWVPPGSTIPLEADGLPALARPGVRTIALANPRHAPYGRAAEAALGRAGVWDAVRDRVVYGENVEQVANILHSGTADAGFLPLSLAQSPTLASGRVWAVHPDLYPPVDQAGVILTTATGPAAVESLRAFLTGPEGQAILARHGFDPPRE
jgi:molybdate transport system substrate-binding protein